MKNVIERAVISTTGNRLRLDLALPNTPTVEQSSSESTPVVPSDYRTVSEFKELEKANLIAALTHANWKT
ncbi:MAG: hypothetical protein HOI35_02290 [Woeseia sp.]|nr:hypothetical protein [Woeseia sp.]